jgi:hypothetical protein
MSSSLINSYGVNFESKTNRDITDAWDKAQERVRIVLIIYMIEATRFDVCLDVFWLRLREVVFSLN